MEGSNFTKKKMNEEVKDSKGLLGSKEGMLRLVSSREVSSISPLIELAILSGN